MKPDARFFYFKGDRGYIHPSNIFDSILAALNEPSPRKVDFSLSRRTGNAWDLVRERADGGTAFLGQYKDASGVLCIIEGPVPVTERKPYDEEAFLALCRMQGDKMRVPEGIRGYSFMEQVISAFKALLLHSVFPQKHLKCSFVRITLDAMPAGDFTVAYRRKVAGAFYEGEIVVRDARVGAIYFHGQERP